MRTREQAAVVLLEAGWTIDECADVLVDDEYSRNDFTNAVMRERGGKSVWQSSGHGKWVERKIEDYPAPPYQSEADRAPDLGGWLADLAPNGDVSSAAFGLTPEHMQRRVDAYLGRKVKKDPRVLNNQQRQMQDVTRKECLCSPTESCECW